MTDERLNTLINEVHESFQTCVRGDVLGISDMGQDIVDLMMAGYAEQARRKVPEDVQGAISSLLDSIVFGKPVDDDSARLAITALQQMRTEPPKGE